MLFALEEHGFFYQMSFKSMRMDSKNMDAWNENQKNVTIY